MKNKYLFLLFSFVLVIGSVFAYSDYGINDVYIKNSITADENFDVNVTLSNNSLVDTTLDVNFNFYNPKGDFIYNILESTSVSANSSFILTKTFDGANDLDLNASTQPHSLIVTIQDPAGTGNPTNNKFIKYFTVAKSSNKIPVPDMPFYFGVLVALFVCFFVYNKKNNSKK